METEGGLSTSGLVIMIGGKGRFGEIMGLGGMGGHNDPVGALRCRVLHCKCHNYRTIQRDLVMPMECKLSTCPSVTLQRAKSKYDGIGSDPGVPLVQISFHT